MLSMSARKRQGAIAGGDKGSVSSLILRCRELKNGPMLEQALIPGRENMCGIGVKPGKELATMAAKLPKLTTAASYANWKKKVTEFSSTIIRMISFRMALSVRCCSPTRAGISTFGRRRLRCFIAYLFVVTISIRS